MRYATFSQNHAAFDAQTGLVRHPAYDFGYHAHIPPGTPVHPVRENLDYALDCLDRGGPLVERALGILARILPLQCVEPADPLYGVYPWYLEEDLHDGHAVDLNWADFVGARLIELLRDHAALLPSDLHEQCRTRLATCAKSCFRRNMGPDYTNIALMGAAVSLLAGELLAEPWLIDYGRSRLARVAAHVANRDGFDEYNSPIYTIIALEEIERILVHGRDPVARDLAQRLHRRAWTLIAEHWHQPTQQWAGPHGRNYEDWLIAPHVGVLAAKIGIPLVHRDGLAVEVPRWAARLPCPDEHRQAFLTPPVERTIRRHFGAAFGIDKRRGIIGTTWMDAQATLGSGDRDSGWDQRRGIIGYWTVPAAPTAGLRVRWLRAGRDFASGALWATQDGPRLLAAAGLWRGMGDWHLSLDRPHDGRFDLRDLRLRIEVRATKVDCVRLSGSRWRLTAGGHQVVIHSAAGHLDGRPLIWQSGSESGVAWVEAQVTPDATVESCEIAALGPSAIGFGLELLPVGSAPADEPLHHAEAGVNQHWNWLNLAVQAPSRPVPWG
jgi:hypothetical protein